MDTVIFHKMQGCGNDFVLIDNRGLALPQGRMADWAKAICPRAVSVGADGLIFLEEPDQNPGAEADYIWHFFNADGSRAEMCGNASRCAAVLAVELGLAGPEHVLGTDAGPVRAQVLGPDTSRVQLTAPKDMELNIPINLDSMSGGATAHFVNTGVPHAVIFSDDADQLDVARLGRELRYHDRFAPAGTNANFAKVLDNEHILLRTYERGVEAETLACGTGAAAGVVLAAALGLTENTVAVTTSGGEELTIVLEDDAVFLQGKALYIYTGELKLKSLGLDA